MTEYYNQLCLLAAVLLACVIGVQPLKCVRSDKLTKVSDIKAKTSGSACNGPNNCALAYSGAKNGTLTVKFLCGNCTSKPNGMECEKCTRGADDCNKYNTTDTNITKVLKHRPECFSFIGKFDPNKTFGDPDKVYCGPSEKCASSVWWESKDEKRAFYGCEADCKTKVVDEKKEIAKGTTATCTACAAGSCADKITEPTGIAPKYWDDGGVSRSNNTPTSGDNKSTTTPKGGNGGKGDSTTEGAAAVSPSHLALTASALLVLAGAASY